MARAAAIGTGILVLLVALVLLRAYSTSNPTVTIPTENRHKVADIAILLDATRSLSEDWLALFKRIIFEKIIPAIGPGDHAAAYAVGERFDPRNIIFPIGADEHMPDLASNDLDLLNRFRSGFKKGQTRARLYELIGRMSRHGARAGEIRSLWGQRIEKLPTEGNTTDLLCALHTVAAGFGTDQDRKDEEEWLFVISDLLHDAPGSRNCEGPQRVPDALAGVHIVLVFPFGQQHEGMVLLNRWRELLEDWGTSDVAVRAAIDVAGQKGPLLPPHPMSGLESLKIPGFLESIRGMFDFLPRGSDPAGSRGG